MFNKSYKQVSAECAILNGKLRRHNSGKLNSSAPVVQLHADSPVKEHLVSWNSLMIAAAIIAFFLLIKGLFTR
ncbi:hypothetical protein AQ505_08820 [Pedobacter sp. PACM 27299]|uniref:hypothetical protein n=1 Tax=Pedobacter sp. PACM 27299 TaxID=1727164 RepID=UPI0007067345|nr:hypothetical protein [Pedobacter sp. PACM 27299]ALL05584.1 hypothetical protein AQ505_08820 [Pedobacter sp. PACM 27299]